MVKIAFYKGKGRNILDFLLNILIRFWTSGDYVHGELVFENSKGEQDWYSISGFSNKGVRVMENFKHNPDNWDIFEIKHVTEVEGYITKLSANRKLGAKYDWLGIFLSQILDLRVNNPKRYFCTEFVTACLINSGIVSVMVSPQTMNPNALYRHLKTVSLLEKV